MDETTPKKKRGRPKTRNFTTEEKRERLIAKTANDALDILDYQENPVLGRDSKFNFPDKRMKLIEQDDEKRAFVAKAIHNNLVFFNAGIEKRVSNDEELCERLNWFFQSCAETQQIPNMEKMGNALGYSVQALSSWANGTNPGFSVHTKDIINQARQILASLDAELATEGKTQPVVYMFRAKNYYDMRDNREITVTPNIDNDYVDQTVIEAKYAELPED